MEKENKYRRTEDLIPFTTVTHTNTHFRIRALCEIPILPLQRMAVFFPEEVLEHVFTFLQADRDRNVASLVCKAWYEIERWSRRRVFVGNCYAASPEVVIRRFPDVRAVEIKGKPHFADFNLLPEGWGGYVGPWIRAMADAYPGLEEIKLKRMVVTDEDLEVIGSSFRRFKVLVLDSCDGFSTEGLASITANCRNLRELNLKESDVEDFGGRWLSNFPRNFTSLVSLNVSCLSSEVNLPALESLVARCPNLKTLQLNRSVPIEKLPRLLTSAPQLVEFGTGSFASEIRPDVFSSPFSSCKNLNALSGFWDVIPDYVPAIYPTCPRITSLNLSCAPIQGPDLVKLVTQCFNLRRLLVLDYIEDDGLEIVASSCKQLQELRVFPSDWLAEEPNVALTEKGLVAVSLGCTNLRSVLYFCRQMSNAALTTIARNRPELVRFRLCIIDPQVPDYTTREPLDRGFGEIVRSCGSLRRLSMSGRLTDKVFEYIGAHAKKLEMLSIAFAGESDLGLHYVLSGCDSLRKLEIRDCPFGDEALLANAGKLETMRSLWMSSCSVSFGACRVLAERMTRVNVEVIDERGPPELLPEGSFVERVYVYRSVSGRRDDMPGFVWTKGRESVSVR